MTRKPVIYQLFLRTWANANAHCKPGGDYATNGSGKLNDITSGILRQLKGLGVTHVWYTGILEHATTTDYTSSGIEADNPSVVKGLAGSPYAVKDYYDIDPDLAVDVDHRMQEFEALVERTHAAGLKVIIDFVPNHVARHYHSDAAPTGVSSFGAGDKTDMFFDPANDFYYITRQQLNLPATAPGAPEYIEFPAKASGNDCYTAYPGMCDWYDTVKLNYGMDPANGHVFADGSRGTWMKMLNILRFWCSKGVDAFRCDMVHMVPLQFWQWAIPQVKEHYPHVAFIAEIYDVALYRPYIHTGRFDYLYDKVTLYDTLRGIRCNGVSAAALTSCWQTVEDIAPHMLNFIENHDEQRFASPQYCGDPRLFEPSMVVCGTISTAPVMIYGGQELGEQALESEGYSGHDGRSTIFDYWSTSTVRRWLSPMRKGAEKPMECELELRNRYAHLLKLCNSEPAIVDGRFFDLMYVNYDNPGIDPHRQYAYLRHAGAGQTLFIAVNFGEHDRELSVNIPRHAFDILGIAEGQYEATELLRGASQKANLEADKPFTTHIGANSAVIWKLKPIKKQKTTTAANSQRKKSSNTKK